MKSLSIELFTEAVHDVERTQYRILGGLKKARDAFEEDRIYPHLAQLVKLYRGLETIVEQSDRMRNPASGTATGVDWEKQELTYQWPELDGDEMSTVNGLIRWALPRVREAIREGKDVYEAVDESLELETVGIVPSYLKEGYLMVPDREDDVLYVLRYTMSVVQDDGERARMLRTVPCRTVEQGGVEPHPSSVKLDLVAERRDLPNPATYFFDTSAPFPYEPTLLPVVKRRLMRHLVTEIGRA